MTRRPPPEECANCGTTVPRSAHACPGCGADERTGWRETSVYDGMELPDSEWAEDQGTHTGSKNGAENRRVNGIAWYWWCAAVALLLLLALSALALV